MHEKRESDREERADAHEPTVSLLLPSRTINCIRINQSVALSLPSSTRLFFSLLALRPRREKIDGLDRFPLGSFGIFNDVERYRKRNRASVTTGKPRRNVIVQWADIRLPVVAVAPQNDDRDSYIERYGRKPRDDERRVSFSFPLAYSSRDWIRSTVRVMMMMKRKRNRMLLQRRETNEQGTRLRRRASVCIIRLRLYQSVRLDAE